MKQKRFRVKLPCALDLLCLYVELSSLAMTSFLLYLATFTHESPCFSPRGIFNTVCALASERTAQRSSI